MSGASQSGASRRPLVLADRTATLHDEHGSFRADSVAIVREIAGSGQIADMPGGWFEPRSIHWSDLGEPVLPVTAPGVEDRRAQFATIADYDHGFGEWVADRSPLEPWLGDYEPGNRSSRIVDYAADGSRLTVEPSRCKVVDTLGGGYGAAIPILPRVRAGAGGHTVPHRAQEMLVLRGLAIGLGSSVAPVTGNASPGAGEVASSLIWDGGKIGLLGAVLVMNSSPADDIGTGREGTPTALAAIRSDAHIESVRDLANSHGAVLYDYVDIGAAESSHRFPHLWSSMELDGSTAGVNTLLGHEQGKWRSWYELALWYSETGEPGGPRPPPPGGPPSNPLPPDPFGGWNPYGPGGDAIPPTGGATDGTGGMLFGPGPYTWGEGVGGGDPGWGYAGGSVLADPGSNWMRGSLGWTRDAVSGAVAFVSGFLDPASGGVRVDGMQTGPSLVVGTDPTQGATGNPAILNSLYFGGLQTYTGRLFADPTMTGNLVMEGGYNAATGDGWYASVWGSNAPAGSGGDGGSVVLFPGVGDGAGVAGHTTIYGNTTIQNGGIPGMGQSLTVQGNSTQNGTNNSYGAMGGMNTMLGATSFIEAAYFSATPQSATFAGNVSIGGILDPTALEFDDASTGGPTGIPGVAGASKARLRYWGPTRRLQLSIAGGNYVDLAGRRGLVVEELEARLAAAEARLARLEGVVVWP